MNNSRTKVQENLMSVENPSVSNIRPSFLDDIPPSYFNMENPDTDVPSETAKRIDGICSLNSLNTPDSDDMLNISQLDIGRFNETLLFDPNMMLECGSQSSDSYPYAISSDLLNEMVGTMDDTLYGDSEVPTGTNPVFPETIGHNIEYEAATGNIPEQNIPNNDFQNLSSETETSHNENYCSTEDNISEVFQNTDFNLDDILQINNDVALDDDVALDAMIGSIPADTLENIIHNLGIPYNMTHAVLQEKVNSFLTINDSYSVQEESSTILQPPVQPPITVKMEHRSNFLPTVEPRGTIPIIIDDLNQVLLPKTLPQDKQKKIIIRTSMKSQSTKCNFIEYSKLNQLALKFEDNRLVSETKHNVISRTATHDKLPKLKVKDESQKVSKCVSVDTKLNTINMSSGIQIHIPQQVSVGPFKKHHHPKKRFIHQTSSTSLTNNLIPIPSTSQTNNLIQIPSTSLTNNLIPIPSTSLTNNLNQTPSTTLANNLTHNPASSQSNNLTETPSTSRTSKQNCKRMIETLSTESSDDEIEDDETNIKRAKQSLVGMSEVDKYRRIREQNNLASRLCREKKKKSQKNMSQDIKTLELENLRLRLKEENLKMEVEKWNIKLKNLRFK